VRYRKTKIKKYLRFRSPVAIVVMPKHPRVTSRTRQSSFGALSSSDFARSVSIRTRSVSGQANVVTLHMSDLEIFRKNTAKTRGRPFQPGNSGRPKGARNRTTVAVEALLDGEAEALTRKAVEVALSGDVTALRLCLDRVMPARKDRPVMFALPKLETPADAVKASAALVEAVASGDLTPSEAAELSKLVDGFTRAVEATDLLDRLERLEAERGYP
jgi:hypothetical protein